MSTNLSHYKFGAVRALVQLHEQQIHSFLEVWKQAKAADVALPETEDDNYESLETLLAHVLDSAAWYMQTMCTALGLPNPNIDSVPDASAIEARADSYTKHLLERWRVPLADIDEEQCYVPVYTTGSGAKLHLDLMLEHALVHPIRHQFQLEHLMAQQVAKN